MAGSASRGTSECEVGSTFIPVRFTSQSGERKLYIITDTTPNLRSKHRERECRLVRVNYGTCRTVFGNETLCGMMTQCDYVQGCRQGCRMRWCVVGHVGPDDTFLPLTFPSRRFITFVGMSRHVGFKQNLTKHRSQIVYLYKVYIFRTFKQYRPHCLYSKLI